MGVLAGAQSQESLRKQKRSRKEKSFDLRPRKGFIDFCECVSSREKEEKEKDP